jgi:hypothetical protein
MRAFEARRALGIPCTHKPLLSMIGYDGEYGDLTGHWTDDARVFRRVWCEAIWYGKYYLVILI